MRVCFYFTLVSYNELAEGPLLIQRSVFLPVLIIGRLPDIPEFLRHEVHLVVGHGEYELDVSVISLVGLDDINEC